MDTVLSHALTVFMGFFAIMNPIANTPVFLGMTAGEDAATRKAIAVRALATAFVIIAVFSAGGHLIFSLFDITLPALRIMGGLLVAMVGYHMLQGGENSTVQHPSEEDAQQSRRAQMDIAISPLALPILAGPGTIATAMNFATGGLANLALTLSTFFLLCVITLLFFVGGQGLVNYLGQNGIKVVTRLMGLILAVIGVQMLLGGIAGAITQYLQSNHLL